MAWLIGKITRGEREILKARGWELLKPKEFFGKEAGFGRDDACVYCDSDLFTIMSGPDWEQGRIRQEQPDLEKACGPRGADMGRPDRLPPEDIRNREVKLFLEELQMGDDGCYDKGGAYWGCGSLESGFMWVAWGDFMGHYTRVFVRALSRAQAETKVRESLPNVLFYR